MFGLGLYKHMKPENYNHGVLTWCKQKCMFDHHIWLHTICHPSPVLDVACAYCFIPRLFASRQTLTKKSAAVAVAEAKQQCLATSFGNSYAFLLGFYITYSI
ncbi:hypothetical protein QQ045_004141 [Rhodiola kirilowii]